MTATARHTWLDIAFDHVIEHAQTEALLRFKEPMQIAVPITGKLEEKFSLMAAVSDVPDVSRKEVTVCARHRFS
jgi:hypothetical protein